MREILFRGKSEQYGWVTGFYTYIGVREKDGVGMEMAHMILKMRNGDAESLTHTIIDPETVGQYTGLKDKNGTEIYEGDIVKSYDGIFASPVEWNESYCGFYPFCAENTSFHVDECEIIGNVYDKEFKTIEN